MTLGKAMLTEKEMRTTLSVVEAQINSCPLTHCSDDTNDPLPLTPAEIIVDRPFQAVTLRSEDVEGSSSRKNLLHAWWNRQKMADSFWKRWSQEYVTQLTAYKKWAQITPALQVGDVVPVSDDRLPRLRWKLGRIKEIFKGRDALLRSAFEKTSVPSTNVPSTNHRTPHIRGCWHFKSGQTLETETLFF